MRQWTLRMAPEPPHHYVTFVARHLPRLTTEAARLVGDEEHADLVYSDALEDVASRWSWLELRTAVAGRDEREAYLRRSLTMRAKRWRDQQLYPVEVHALAEYDMRPYGWPESDVHGSAPLTTTAGPLGPADQPYPAARRPRRAVWVSVALRRAEHVGDTVRDDARPIAEAAIAWWHAYERHRRFWRNALVVGLIVFMVLLIQVGDALIPQ